MICAFRRRSVSGGKEGMRLIMKIDDMIDIENILYERNKEEIAKILKKYKVSYQYDKNNFKFVI